MRKAIYADSFDPITSGHMWTMEQGAKLFDELVVALDTNSEKKYTFSGQERTQMLADFVSELSSAGKSSVDRFGHQ